MTRLIPNNKRTMVLKRQYLIYSKLIKGFIQAQRSLLMDSGLTYLKPILQNVPERLHEEIELVSFFVLYLFKSI